LPLDFFYLFPTLFIRGFFVEFSNKPVFDNIFLSVFFLKLEGKALFFNWGHYKPYPCFFLRHFFFLLGTPIYHPFFLYHILFFFNFLFDFGFLFSCIVKYSHKFPFATPDISP